MLSRNGVFKKMRALAWLPDTDKVVLAKAA